MRFETRCKITAFLRPDQILHLGKSKVQNTVIQHVVILRLGKMYFRGESETENPEFRTLFEPLSGFDGILQLDEIGPECYYR